MDNYDEERIEFENRKYRDSAVSEKDSETIFKEKPYTRDYSIQQKDPKSSDRMPVMKESYMRHKKYVRV